LNIRTDYGVEYSVRSTSVAGRLSRCRGVVRAPGSALCVGGARPRAPGLFFLAEAPPPRAARGRLVALDSHSRSPAPERAFPARPGCPAPSRTRDSLVHLLISALVAASGTPRIRTTMTAISTYTERTGCASPAQLSSHRPRSRKCAAAGPPHPCNPDERVAEHRTHVRRLSRTRRQGRLLRPGQRRR
jgi:hypothetical protein